ncbi:pro-neuregulin-1, membrane-bound isoform isoform X7 [Siphateles boraxobius]|uniref:pro-neuregulin-1, membrane-bound isoform isoform X7 n=1 Tax=Siphateles boraxobius TaxID=180520 RepID=UPI00406456AB
MQSEDIPAGLASQEAPSEALSEVSTKETPEEAEEDVPGDGEQGPSGYVPLPLPCCVCLDLERVSNCVRSEKICILPILACLLSLALCTAGLKWVFVDKIFEYEPPTHLDLKRIGHDPVINSDFTQNPVSVSTSTASPPVPGQPKVFVEGGSTAGPVEVSSSKVAVLTPTAAVTVRTNSVSPPKPKSTFKPVQNATNANQYPTLESNEIVPKTSATSTTPSAKTSSHMTPCSESERKFCVNGGKCYTLEVTPGNIRHLCRCPNEFTGDRCQSYVMASFYKHLGIEFMAEELYQKRVLTITGICIALLVVGIMCVVAYCKTKKQRKKLHDRLRQSLRERNAAAKGAPQPQPPPENLQLVNHYMPNNPVPPHVHVTDREAETSLSTTEFTSSTHVSSAITRSSSLSWSNGKADSVVSDTHAVLVKSENSRHGTPGPRGRLNATGGVHQLNDHLTSCRDTQASCRDSPHSERYVSAITTPARVSPVGLLSPTTPSEMSAPLSSLATPVPSSPSGEEERPLLFLRDKPSAHQSQTGQNLRHSAHYNHGLDLPSPVHTEEQESSSQRFTSTGAPSSPSHRTQAAPEPELSGSPSESSGSESETEDEDTPFLGSQNPAVSGGLVQDGLEGSRTNPNPALLLSPKHDLQSRLTARMAKQDPIAV